MYRGNSDSCRVARSVSYRYEEVPIENAAPRDQTTFATTNPAKVVARPYPRIPAERNTSLRRIVRLRPVRSAITPTGSWKTRSPIQNATSTRVNSKSEPRFPRIQRVQNGIQMAKDDAAWYK